MSSKSSKPNQLTQAEVERMSKAGDHAGIEKARTSGRLDDLLGINRHCPPADGQWSGDDLAAMYKAGRVGEIDQARRAGQLDTILGRPDDAA